MSLEAAFPSMVTGECLSLSFEGFRQALGGGCRGEHCQRTMFGDALQDLRELALEAQFEQLVVLVDDNAADVCRQNTSAADMVEKTSRSGYDDVRGRRCRQ